MFRLATAHVAVLTLAVISAAPARAEPVPAAAVDKDYETCMGGQTAQQDAQRDQYCQCVRDGLRGWDSSTYAQVSQQAQTTGTQSPPPQLEDLAKACIAKVLK